MKGAAFEYTQPLLTAILHSKFARLKALLDVSVNYTKDCTGPVAQR